MDLEGGSVGFVGGRGGGIILGVKLNRVIVDIVSGPISRKHGRWERATYEASDRAALLSGHPQVARSGVEHDLEQLRRRAEFDLGKVLSVHVV